MGGGAREVRAPPHTSHTSLVSKISRSAPPLANFGTSAPVALPSGLPNAAWMSAALSKVRMATRWIPDGPAGEPTGPLLMAYFFRPGSFLESGMWSRHNTCRRPQHPWAFYTARRFQPFSSSHLSLCSSTGVWPRDEGIVRGTRRDGKSHSPWHLSVFYLTKAPALRRRRDSRAGRPRPARPRRWHRRRA